MTNPFGSNPGDNGGNRDDRDNAFGSSNGGGLPRYEPTSHPEDQAGFGSNSYGGNYSGYGNYSAQDSSLPGYAGANDYSASNGGAPTAEAGPAYTGKVSALYALKWGFVNAVRNPVLWLLGAIALFAVQYLPILVVQIATGFDENSSAPTVAQGIMTIVSVVLGIAIYRLALFQVDDPRTSWSYLFKNVRWGSTLVVSIIVGVVTGILALIAVFIGFAIFGGTVGFEVLNNPDGMSDEQIFGMLGTIFGVIAVLALVSFLLSPLWFFMTWMAADGASVGEAISRGFKLGTQNYAQVLLYSFLLGAMSLASIITFGLALIVVAPAGQLAAAHLLRQAKGAYAPEVTSR
ncbi:hypothetical protein [Corynebacterium sp.]|uniref:hypothetical protein n=1 Tax=Corynebacterium sp. TaxID=1720 RepID=UPI0026DC395F|nr:hypothetical protein [Corynebacterium sp.]MDO5031697.1 hypothetical protein [Corynebacterium sp.]